MPDVQEQIRAAAALLRSYGAVAVLGAGVSAARYPMTAQLPPLLWQAIEDTPLTLAELRKRAGIGGSAKQILGSGGSSLRLGWHLVREYPEARRAFQTAFAALDADREPSLTHLSSSD